MSPSDTAVCEDITLIWVFLVVNYMFLFAVCVYEVCN